MSDCEDIKINKRHLCWTSEDGWGTTKLEMCKKCQEKYESFINSKRTIKVDNSQKEEK